MDADTLFLEVLEDLLVMERITEAKIQATINRHAESLVALLQEQIDPMHRLSAHSMELPTLPDVQRAELGTHIARWATREQYLKDLLEKNLGYIDYLKQLLGIAGVDYRNLNLGL